MAKLVTLDPPKELTFDFGKSGSSEQRLRISNVTNSSVAFKVKTTAPKAYLVRPSNDVLAPNGSVEVQILLQPGVVKAGDSTPHRFLVQAASLGASRTSNYSKEEWGDLPKDSVQEYRLSVAEANSKGVRGSSGDMGGNLQEKYDNLVKYTVGLEKETLKLQTTRDEMQKKIEARGNEFEFQLWHMILAMILAVALLKLPNYL